MRVLFLAHSFPRHEGDAAGAFVLHLAQALAALEVEVQVVAPAARALAPCETLEGITVHRFRYAPRSHEVLAYGGNMAELVRSRWTARAAMLGFLGGALVKLRAIRRRFRPDLIHAHWWFPSGLIATLPAARDDVPLVTTLHGTDVRIARDIATARPLFRRVMRQSAAVTAVSSWLAQEAQRVAPRVQPTVAPMPVATDRFAPVHGERGGGMLYVGRLTEQKGVDRLLAAVARMREPTPLDVVGDGARAQHLRALAATLGIADRVRWHGALPPDALRERYAAAEVLVVPSHDEGLGLVAVEAMLCETPVVAFDSGGLRDIVEHERTGLLVPEHGDEAGMLAGALDTLLDPAAADRRRAFGSLARRRALERFAPPAVAQRYLGVYRQAMAADASTS